MRNFVVEEWSCEGTAKIAKVNALLKFSSVSDLFLEITRNAQGGAHHKNFGVEGA